MRTFSVNLKLLLNYLFRNGQNLKHTVKTLALETNESLCEMLKEARYTLNVLYTKGWNPLLGL